MLLKAVPVYDFIDAKVVKFLQTNKLLGDFFVIFSMISTKTV